MLPGQLPQWLDYALSENTAAAMFRGLQGLSARWGELIAAAQLRLQLRHNLFGVAFQQTSHGLPRNLTPRSRLGLLSDNLRRQADDLQEAAVAQFASDGAVWGFSATAAELYRVDPGTGKVYELWYQPSPGAKMVPAGVFSPSDGSVAGAPVTVGKSFVLVAVTVEPGPKGSPQPTSQPILAAQR